MRKTISDLIDEIHTRLGDDGTISSRSEIKDWLLDGYARMIREAQTPAAIEGHDMPPRVMAAITHDWERDYIKGTTRKFTFKHHSGRYDCTYLHEVSQQGDQTSVPSRINMTQLHGLDYVSSNTDAPYRFALPRRYDILGVWYDHKILYPIPSSEIESRGDYWDVSGIPTHYTTNEGSNEFDLYRVVTSNQGAYKVSGRPIGVLRKISGDRTYAVDSKGEDGVGVVRSISSPDRQYHSHPSFEHYGTIRAASSTEDNLAIYKVLKPERDISEHNTLAMLPSQFEKYIKFYALAMIHNRAGEFYEPNMAEHYRFRYRRGVQLLSRIRNVAFRDSEYGRDIGIQRSRSVRPRLPDNYPRVRW